MKLRFWIDVQHTNVPNRKSVAGFSAGNKFQIWPFDHTSWSNTMPIKNSTSKNSKLKILHNRLDWLYRHTWQCIWVHKEYCINFFSAGFVPNIMTAKCKPRIKKKNKWIPQLQTESIYCKKETSRPPVTKCGRLGLCWNKLRIRTLFRISIWCRLDGAHCHSNQPIRKPDVELRLE